MKKLKDLLKESVEMGRVYSNPFATTFVKESEEPTNDKTEMTEEQKQAFYEAVKQYRRYGEAVYRNAGLSEVYEAIKNMVEVAGKVTLSETGDWFDNVTVGRHMKRMGESFRVFEKTLKEVSTLQQRLEASYDEIGEVLGKYYEISELNEIEEGNEFGSARAKAIANGDSEFEVDGKTYKVTNVDKEDKENAEKFANESMKLTDMIKKPSITESNTEYLHIIRNGNDVEYLHSKHDNPNLGGQLYPEKHAKRMMKRPNINVLNWSGTHGKYVKESVNEATKYKVGQQTPVGKIIGTSVWGKGSKQEWFYDVQKPGYSPVPYSEKSLDKIMGESVNEAKYDIGMARKGNGLTIYNKAEEDGGDYKNIAHIDNKGNIKLYDKKLPTNIKKMIEKEAEKLKESVNEGKKMIKLKDLLNESIGIGELPSSKLMKMKVPAKDMLKSVNEARGLNEHTYNEFIRDNFPKINVKKEEIGIKSALKALGVKSGDEIEELTNTMDSTNTALYLTNAKENGDLKELPIKSAYFEKAYLGKWKNGKPIVVFSDGWDEFVYLKEGVLKAESSLPTNKSINEAKLKKVTKQMWAKMDYDERVNALLTFFKDPNDAEEYGDSDWNNLPSGADGGMYIFE